MQGLPRAHDASGADPRSHTFSADEARKPCSAKYYSETRTRKGKGHFAVASNAPTMLASGDKIGARTYGSTVDDCDGDKGCAVHRL